METLGFWAVAAAMAGGVAALLMASLAAGRRSPAAAAPARDLQIYRDQLRDVERDVARGTLPEAEAGRLRTEIARRLLDADRKGTPAETRRGSLVLPGVVVLAAAAGALSLYARTGAPGYPDLPLAARLAQSDSYLSTRPSQERFLALQGKPRDMARIATLRADLARSTDLTSLRADFSRHAGAEDFLAAVLTMDRVLDLRGDAASATDHASLAFALFLEADTYVSPEAEAQLKLALTLDPQNESARYLLGEMFLQARRFDLTFDLWRPILESGAQTGPWLPTIRDSLPEISELAGRGQYEAPSTKGPTGEDIAATADLSEADRTAMIEGMVSQLSDRLANQGGSPAEWAQLVQALGVLGRKADAQEIYDEAKRLFATAPEDLALLNAAATAAGITP